MAIWHKLHALRTCCVKKHEHIKLFWEIQSHRPFHMISNKGVHYNNKINSGQSSKWFSTSVDSSHVDKKYASGDTPTEWTKTQRLRTQQSANPTNDISNQHIGVFLVIHDMVRRVLVLCMSMGQRKILNSLHLSKKHKSDKTVRSDIHLLSILIVQDRQQCLESVKWSMYWPGKWVWKNLVFHDFTMISSYFLDIGHRIPAQSNKNSTSQTDRSPRRSTSEEICEKSTFGEKTLLLQFCGFYGFAGVWYILQ